MPGVILRSDEIKSCEAIFNRNIQSTLIFDTESIQFAQAKRMCFVFKRSLVNYVPSLWERSSDNVSLDQHRFFKSSKCLSVSVCLHNDSVLRRRVIKSGDYSLLGQAIGVKFHEKNEEKRKNLTEWVKANDEIEYLTTVRSFFFLSRSVWRRRRTASSFILHSTTHIRPVNFTFMCTGNVMRLLFFDIRLK